MGIYPVGLGGPWADGKFILENIVSTGSLFVNQGTRKAPRLVTTLGALTIDLSSNRTTTDKKTISSSLPISI